MEVCVDDDDGPDRTMKIMMSEEQTDPGSASHYSFLQIES